MPRAGLDRSAVVGLALAVLDESPGGLADLTLAAVAARAGVAVPSLYKHVDGLPGLRRDVARACVEDFTETLDEAAPADAEPEQRLRAMADALRGYARRHPGRYRAVQVGGWPQDADATGVQVAAARTVALMSETVAGLGVPAARHVDAVRAVRAALHGFVVLELDGGFGMPDDVDVSYRYLVDGLVRGLLATEDTPVG